jgi:hypothetical protein
MEIRDLSLQAYAFVPVVLLVALNLLVQAVRLRYVNRTVGETLSANSLREME